MNSMKIKTLLLVGSVIILTVGSLVVVKWKNARAVALERRQQETKIATAVTQIEQVNAGLPGLQVEAKTLIFAAMIQRRIPAASKWCETLNAGGKIWPTTPTNTIFAMNSEVAGRVYSKTNRLAGDVVVFFEASSPGWNQAGGAKLLAGNAGGVAVAFADGRSMIVNPADAAKLRWTP